MVCRCAAVQSCRRRRNERTRDGITEKCAGFDSLAVFCWLHRSVLSAASGQFMHLAQTCFALWLCWPCSMRTAASRAGRVLARKARRASRTARSNGWCRRPIPTRAAHAVLFRPPGDGPFRLARDRACLDPERAASRANAAAGIPRAGGVAGRARLCRAGAGAARPWRDRRRLSRGPGRLRRGRLRRVGPRHGGRDLGCALDYLRRQILHPARTARS